MGVEYDGHIPQDECVGVVLEPSEVFVELAFGPYGIAAPEEFPPEQAEEDS